MRNYEGMFIISPAVNENDLDAYVKRVEEVIKKNGGEIVKETSWGKRKLAYSIKKQEEGYYYLLDFKMETPNLKALDSAYKLMEDILRYMIIVKEAEGKAVSA